MAIVLPKDRRYLTGFRFNELIPFEMNTLTIDTLLPSVFRKAILDGRDARRSNDPTIADIDASIKRLTAHDRLSSFESDSSVRMLRRFAQSLLFVPIRNQKRKELEINGLIPYTLAPYAVGFPTNLAGFRQVDQFLYYMLLDESRSGKEGVRQLIVETFGDGIELGRVDHPQAHRKLGDYPDIDVIAELSIAYAETFPPINAGKEGLRGYVAATPLPLFQANFGRHLFRYLSSYADRQPRTMMIDQIESLIAFELLILTMRLVEHAPSWESDPQSNLNGLVELNAPEIYVDFSGDPRTLSRTIATRCVGRDLERIPLFVQSVLKLRYLDALVGFMRRRGPIRKLIEDEFSGINDDDTTRYLAATLRVCAQQDLLPHLYAQAGVDLYAILEANRSNASSGREDLAEDELSDADRLVEEFAAQGLDDIEQVQQLLIKHQASKATGNVLGWIRDVSRIEARDGMMVGGATRSNWAYAPSNELLSVLVQLCAIDTKFWNPKKNRTGPELFSVQDFLDWLYDQFGIVVDRPPAGLGLDGPEYATAARENLQAMLRKLRQMGMFEDQSDDFAVQQITPPFMDQPGSERGAEAGAG